MARHAMMKNSSAGRFGMPPREQAASILWPPNSPTATPPVQMLDRSRNRICFKILRHTVFGPVEDLHGWGCRWDAGGRNLCMKGAPHVSRRSSKTQGRTTSTEQVEDQTNQHMPAGAMSDA
eukprot:361917-Chlamydomonas_euryale.AAC.6